VEYNKTEIINAITNSNILELYLRNSLILGKLLNNPDDSNIHYGSEFLPTKYQKEIYERRAKIALIDGADEISKTNANALKKVLEFMEKYPKNEIFVVTFNGKNEHYDVWCGLPDNQIEVLCIMKGGHIPDSAFKA